MRVRFEPATRLEGELSPPPDKSISHRAALLAAMSSEPVQVRNYLDAEDTNSTLSALRELGVVVESRPDELVIRGGGLRDLSETGTPIDVGNSGTLIRLLPGWLAAQEGGSWTLDGDESIRGRPIDRIARPLSMMGARIEATQGRFAPFTVHGARLHGLDYESPVASAQVKSSVLLAGLLAYGEVAVTEPLPSRDHTERLLARAGVGISRQPADGEEGPWRVEVANVDELEIEAIDVPGDLSSAAFLIVAGVLVAGSRLLLRDVGVNWTRCGFLRILERMGAIVLGDFEPRPVDGELPTEEPVSEIDVTHGPLVGTEVEPEEVPLAIDELPLVALLGAFAEGETVVRGAAELRVKESDRIDAVVNGLRGLGAQIEGTPDGFVVSGTGGLKGGVMDSQGDHRLAMLGAIAGLASREGVTVERMDAATISYPLFLEHIGTLA
jgi:3-phosphoshikimate 1-carboxyvinyltransferase